MTDKTKVNLHTACVVAISVLFGWVFGEIVESENEITPHKQMEIHDYYERDDCIVLFYDKYLGEKQCDAMGVVTGNTSKGIICQNITVRCPKE